MLSKIISMGTLNDGEVDTLQASFTASPGRTLLTGSVPFETSLGLRPNQAAPVCAIPGYRQLNAGTLMLQSPGASSISVPAEGQGNQISYSAMLSSGVLQPGTFTVSSSGPSQTGEFAAAFPFGQDIQITTPPPVTGSILNSGQTLSFHWTGGEANSLVSVTLISHQPLFDYVNSCGAPAAAGQCTLYSVTYMGTTSTTILPSTNGELLYQITPNSPISFSAPGLSLGGQVIWQIQHLFAGFAIQ